MRVNGKLCMIQPKLLCANLIDLSAQSNALRGWQKTVTAGNDQMYIFWKTVGKGTKEAGNATICKQVKIVNENVAGVLSHQFMA